jgi:hypothetical protein
MDRPAGNTAKTKIYCSMFGMMRSLTVKVAQPAAIQNGHRKRVLRVGH